MEFISEYFAAFIGHAINVLMIPFNPKARIFVLYLATSIIIAFIIFNRSKKVDGEEPGQKTSFLRFLFPKHVWSTSSAWLDVRYFFFHGIIGKFLMIGLTAWAAVVMFWYVSGGLSLLDFPKGGNHGFAADLAIATVYMFVTLLVSDFIAYGIHYMQHKVPLLWQFHKVHHSLEVMHPISNYREHPFDNLLYNLFTGAGFGMTAGLAYKIFGYLPSMPSLIGVPLLMLAFNMVGYNLRHSHVWLRWPGRWSMVFPSPAHHHVHHSYHPDHIDKNFAFLFPIWDVIFKTYTLPEDNRDIRFGLGGDQGKEFTSCLKLYFIPVRDAYRLFRKPHDAKQKTPDLHETET